MKKTIWSKVKCSLGIFLIGGLAYNMIEILWRGRTHWSMFIVGGLCFQIIGRIQNAFHHLSIFRRSVLCSAAITAVEFVSGCVVNLYMKLNVWDYSNMFGNIRGQVCLLYSVLWGGLSVIAMPVYSYCRHFLERGRKPRQTTDAQEVSSPL